MHIRGVLLMPDYIVVLEFGLGLFGALCKISDSTIFERLLLQQFLSNFNQTSYKVSQLGDNIGYYFSQRLQKIWHFDFFLNTGRYGAGNFKRLLLQQFSLDPIQTL